MTDSEPVVPTARGTGLHLGRASRARPTIAAAVCYVAACLVWPLLLFNWIPALGFLLAVTWLSRRSCGGCGELGRSRPRAVRAAQALRVAARDHPDPRLVRPGHAQPKPVRSAVLRYELKASDPGSSTAGAGVGFTHSLAFGVVVAGLVYLVFRSSCGRSFPDRRVRTS